MIRSKDEIINGFNEIIGENADDNILTFIEDISDTIDDLTAKGTDTENWKEKYENNDREWRQRYKDRFMNKDNAELSFEVETEEPAKPKTFDDLFD